MQSLVASVPNLAWGADHNKNAILDRALTYLTMYSTLGMVRYSYGVSLLSRADIILAPVPTTPSTSTSSLGTPLISILGLDTSSSAGDCTLYLGDLGDASDGDGDGDGDGTGKERDLKTHALSRRSCILGQLQIE